LPEKSVNLWSKQLEPKVALKLTGSDDEYFQNNLALTVSPTIYGGNPDFNEVVNWKCKQQVGWRTNLVHNLRRFLFQWQTREPVNNFFNT
jgi:hypothetical protein